MTAEQTESSETGTLPNTLQHLQQWQRLDPIALFYFTLQSLQAVFGSVFYLIPFAFFMLRGLREAPLQTIGLFLGGLSLLLLIAVLRYWFYRFRVTADTVDIYSGIIQKTQLNLPFERIQNVKLEQPLYYRLSDHVIAKLETAGSSAQEAKLVALSRSQAEALQQTIYAAHETQAVTPQKADAVSQDDAAATTDTVSHSTEQLLNRRSLGDLLIYGVSNNRVWVFLAASAPFWQQLLERGMERLDSLGIDMSHWFDPSQQHWLWLVAAVLMIVFLGLLLMAALSIAGAILSYFDYTLVRQGERYIQRCGLFTRHEVSMKLSRLQWVELQQSWLDRLWGRCNARFEQIKAPQAGVGEQGRIMVPAVKPAEADALLHDAWPQQALQKAVFKPINWRFVLRQCVLWWLPLMLISVFVVRPAYPWAAYTLFGLAAWLLLLIFLRWRRWGYDLDDQFLYIRKGLIGVNHYCVPVFKVQQVQYQQSWFLERHGLCHLNLVFASGALKLPFMPWKDAQVIFNYSLYQAESSGKSWM